MSKFTGNIIRLPAVTPTQNSASGVYTLDDQFTAQSSGTWPIVRDQYFNYTTLLLTGAVQGTAYPNPVTQPYSFLSDASTNNFVVSPNGDVSARPFNPYLNNYSNYFNGSSGVNFANNAGFDFSTGDFTIESWVYIAGNSALDGSSRRYANIFSVSTTGAFNVNFVVRGDSTTTGTGLEIYNGTSTVAVTGSISQNAWNHVAVSRSGANAYFWLNGQQMGATQSISGSWGSSANAGQVGQSANTVGYSFPLIGYLSNVRVVKGRAVYTSAFTPSTTPLTRTSGGTNPPQGTECVLLTCQSNRFLDSNGPNVPASSPLTTTVSGSPAVSQNSPFVSYDTTNGSGYFDGTGDYLNTASQSAFNVSNGAFTVEFWVYPTNLSVNQGFISSTFSSNFHVAYLTTGSLLYFWIANSQVNADVSSQLKANQWNHIAVARGAANAVAGWVNGVKLLTGNLSGTGSAQPIYIGTSSHSLTETTFGYISNARMVNGTDVYGVSNSTIPIPTAPLQAVTNTSLLTLQTRAPATNNGFIDSSPNNFVVTRNGNTTQGSFSPFSPTGWGNYFGGSGNNLTSPIGSIASGASFTFEFWAYFTGSLTTNVRFFDLNSFSFAAQNLVYRLSGNSTGSGAAEVSMNGSQSSSATGVIKTNQWQHHAVTYNGTTISVFVDGVRKISFNPTAGSLLTTVAIGSSIAAAEYFAGYISNFRLVIGSTVYDPTLTTISVPTAPLTAISGTSLLTCQSNRFRDASSNNFTITANGSPSVQAFSPFAPAQSYIPSQIGGSGYFDGNGDYLTSPSDIAFAVGTGDFTLEAWAYWVGTLSVFQMTGSSNDNFNVYFNGTSLSFYNGTVTTTISGLVINKSSWNHIALVRASGTAQFYLNGVAAGSGFALSTNWSTAMQLAVGRNIPVGTGYADGYISGFRFVKGTAVYTSSFPIPTAPPTVIPNTSLLLNFTNGGIVDATGKNNLETVANSGVQTTQAKWSPGSMYFDGTDDRLTNNNASNPLYAFRTGDFTIEFWVNPNNVSAAANQGMIQTSTTAGGLSTTLTNGVFIAFGQGSVAGTGSDGGVYARIANNHLGGNAVATTGVWQHIALCRASGTAKLFVNGNQIATLVNSSDITGTYIAIGGYYTTAFLLNGYLDDVRVSNFGRYVEGTGANAGKMVFNGTNTLALPTGPFPLG